MSFPDGISTLVSSKVLPKAKHWFKHIFCFLCGESESSDIFFMHSSKTAWPYSSLCRIKPCSGWSFTPPAVLSCTLPNTLQAAGKWNIAVYVHPSPQVFLYQCSKQLKLSSPVVGGILIFLVFWTVPGKLVLHFQNQGLIKLEHFLHGQIMMGEGEVVLNSKRTGFN